MAVADVILLSHLVPRASRNGWKARLILINRVHKAPAFRHLDDFRFARYLYGLLPEQDKKSLSLYGDITFDDDIYVVVRICQKEGFIELSDSEDGFLYVAIAILPEYRGKGIADTLLNRALTYADKPVRYVTRKDNGISLGFIQKRNDFSLVEDNTIAFVYEQVAKLRKC